MSRPLADVRDELEAMLRDSSNIAFSASEYEDSISRQARILAPEVGVGDTAIGTVSFVEGDWQYDLPAGAASEQYLNVRRVEFFHDPYRAILSKLQPADLMERRLFRQGNGVPVFFALHEKSDQVVELLIDPPPNASYVGSANIVASFLPENGDVDPIPFADDAIEAIKTAAALELLSAMSAEDYAARKLDPTYKDFMEQQLPRQVLRCRERLETMKQRSGSLRRRW